MQRLVLLASTCKLQQGHLRAVQAHWHLQLQGARLIEAAVVLERLAVHGQLVAAHHHLEGDLAQLARLVDVALLLQAAGSRLSFHPCCPCQPSAWGVLSCLVS